MCVFLCVCVGGGGGVLMMKLCCIICKSRFCFLSVCFLCFLITHVSTGGSGDVFS